MGWKTIERHYGIKHIVQVGKRQSYGDEPVIMIGSPYISDIIVIRISDGKLLKRYNSGHTNDLLRELQPKLDEDERSGKLKELIDTPDTFGELLPVYYIGDNKHVRLEYCENFGYPNCTTAGKLMYENLYFETPEKAKEELLNRTKVHWEYWRRDVKDRWIRIWEEICRFKYNYRDLWESIYVRCWGRFFVKKGKYIEYD